MAEWNVPGFTELRMLGSGNFGEVVLARHDGSGTLVAIKYLRHNLLSDAEFTGAFRSEAAVLATVNDPHVVRLYEYVESPQGAAIVMELVDGVCLREILTHQGATTAEAALVVLQGSLLGLAAAHRRGVVHRDYKPGNVLVNGDGDSKLTDFGIAARAGDSPIPAGTLVYAPPEQIEGSPASPAGDVYAATATFYECLVGRPPFTGNTAERLMYQHLAEPVPLDPVPEPLRPLVAAGMAKDPRDRPADASTFVTELTAVAAGAYGRGWQERGRSHLGEAALVLAALWPSGAAPALQGSAVERIDLSLRVPGDPWRPGNPGICGTCGTSSTSGTSSTCARSPPARSCSLCWRPARPWPPRACISLVLQVIQTQRCTWSRCSRRPRHPRRRSSRRQKASPGPSAASTTPLPVSPPTSASASASAAPKPKPKKSKQPSPSPSPKPSPSPSASPSPTITLHPPSSPSSPPPRR